MAGGYNFQFGGAMERQRFFRLLSRGIGPVLLGASLLACHDSSPTSPSMKTIPAGIWGGTQVLLTVSENGGTWQQTCASGMINSPMTVEASGRFDLPGQLTRSLAGPIGTGGTHPARYTGMSDGMTMTLTIVTTDDNQTFGPFVLVLGQQTQVGPCPIV